MEPSSQQSFLDRLREHPTHKRHMYAAGSSLAIVAVIFVIWLTVKMPGQSENQVVAVEDTKTQQTESILGSFGDSVGQVFTGFKNAVSSFTDNLGGKESYESNTDPFQTDN